MDKQSYRDPKAHLDDSLYAKIMLIGAEIAYAYRDCPEIQDDSQRRANQALLTMRAIYQSEGRRLHDTYSNQELFDKMFDIFFTFSGLDKFKPFLQSV
ncbi:MAG: hypothetical protein HY514_01445 [Candidatus Aenigmarchaeota archaeon]|nr:hypothetical protein [Candidatus Aenigmarchaeota archaeon]